MIEEHPKTPRDTWVVRPLKHALFRRGSSGAAIKGTVSSEPEAGLFAGYSASGQDVWLKEAAFSGPGIVLSAVGARCGRCFLADGGWGVVANTAVFQPKPGYENRYLWYVLNVDGLWIRGGSAQPYVVVPESLAQRWPFPPLPEQTQIARFLDYETAKIDRLIEKQQQLIDLLKEKRQAVISHAVTKGLNPDAPMKDSGVEWLGQVPAHWTVLPVRHALRIDNGPRLPINREERSKMEGPYPYWGPTGILDHIDHYRYQGERALLGEDGDHFLKFSIWPMTHWATGRFNVNNHAHVIADGQKCSARWFYYSFLHRDIGADVIAQGVSRLKLTREGLSKLILAVPPLEEQQAIIAHVEPVISKVETATSKAEQQITLLQERRTALISAAVTGKIDVRTWTPPEAA